MPKISNLTTVWNNLGTTYEAVKMAITDTASAAGSKLMNFSVNGSSKFSVDKSGNVTALGAVTAETGTTLLTNGVGTLTSQFTESSVEARTAYRLFTTEHGAHADEAHYSVGLETRPAGSTKNGPTSADVGLGISVIKEGYAGASRPTNGEIDGMYIVVRQDGPQGLANGDSGSSDSAGILIDAANIGDAGFVAAIEASTSNIAVSDRSTVDYRIQTQMGVMTMNASPSPITYGMAVIARAGANTHAFYAGNSGGTWTNLFKCPNILTIDGAGGYHIQTADWPTYSARFARADGINDSLTISQRGTGPIAITTVDAGAITLNTTNTGRWQVSATGNLLPITDNAYNIGSANARVSAGYFYNLDLADDGRLRWVSTTYTSGAGYIIRGTLDDDAMSIIQRGTGGLQISTQEAAVINIATNNTQRWQFNAAGTFLPATDLAVNIGSASKKVSSIYAEQIVLSGNNQQMNALPAYADNAAAVTGGLAAGRIYRTATGELRIVV